MAEPLGVAFVEIEPIAPAFRAKTEAQLRAQLAGVSAGIPPSPATAAATKQVQGHALASEQAAAAHRVEAVALEQKAVAASGAAAAEARAAGATAAHGAASKAAATNIAREAAAMTGLNAASGGLSAPLLAGAAAATILFTSLKEADRFNEQMKLIESSTGAGADQMERASDVAIQYGRDLNLPRTTAVDAATAINLLTRSGFDLAESQTVARGALLLTAASGEELATSVALTDQIMDAFNLRAEDSVRVADTLAAGLKFTGGSAREAGSALTTLAPIADSLGLSLEDVNTLVLQLAESGISTSRGASVLRQSLLRLGTPSVAKGLAEVGISMDTLVDSQGQLRPDAFARLAEALDDLSGAEQRRVLTQAFGARGALAVIRLVEQQREGYNRMSTAARDSGAAQREAEARTASFGGTLKETKAEAADFGRQLGQTTTGPATAYVGMLGDILRGANDAAFAVSALAGGVADIGGSFASAVPGGERFVDVLQKGILLQAFPVVGIAKGISTVVGHFRKGEQDVSSILDDMNKGVAAKLDELARIITAKAQALPDIGGAVGTSLGTQLAVAQATGTDADQLAILRKQRAAAQTRLDRNTARTDLTPAQRNAQITQAANDVKAADDAIQAILDKQKSASAASAAAAQSKADDIARAADERDRAFLEAQRAFIGEQQTRIATRQGAVTAAASTPELGDDLAASARLRDALTASIAATRQRIQQARAAGRESDALVKELGTLRASKNQVRREIDALQAEQRQQAASTRVEQAELSLQIAEARIGSDPNARQTATLVTAHQRVIAALRKQQGLTKKRSVEYRRLQLQIEQEKAAIRDLKKASKADNEKAGRTFAQDAFQFMQTLQGFSSSLVSNLIPGGATGGLVGAGPGGPPAAAQQPRGLGSPFTRQQAGGGATRPVSSGQGNTQIDLLRRILSEQRKANRGNAHPEASAQRRRGAAAGDYAYQGTHGM